MLSFGNITKHPGTTKGGILVGALQFAIMAAAEQYLKTGNTTDWKPYAYAAATAAVPVIVGAMSPSLAPVAPASDPAADHKAQLMAQVDAALTEAAQQAMAAEAAKVVGQITPR